MSAETVDTATGEITASPTPYQLLPRLSDDEYADLRTDIAESGIRVPIDVDEAGTVIDGHHRAWIAADLGIDCPRRVVAGLTEEQKRDHALSVNVHRRNLTREQRRDLVARLRQEGMPVRAIAKAMGSTVGTVARDLSTVPNGTVPERITGADGKSRPASRVTVTTTRTETVALDGPAVPTRRQQIDVSRRVNSALTDIDGARRRLSELTPAHLHSQSSEARSSWAANLAEQLEALHGFLDALNNKEK